MRQKAGLGKLLLALAVIFSVVVLVADVASAPAAVSSGHSHGEIATPAHSTLSVAFALLGPVVLVAGLILSYPDSVRRLQEMALVAGLTLLYVDGVLHWLAVLEHLREAVSAAFFIVSGAVQVGAIPSSVVIRKLQEKLLWFVGVVLTVFFIEL